MLDYITLNNFISLLQLLLDITVVSVVIYYFLKIIKNNSRTIQLAKGIIFIFIIHWGAQQLGLRTVETITTQFLNWGFLVIIILFTPEIRSMIEKLGKTTALSSMSNLNENEKEVLIDELVKTCSTLSQSQTGALISIERTNSMEDFIQTGTPMNSDVSSELLCSIFVPGTPLHDGAVIIRGNKIACASAYFPPTVKDFPSSYGARHRAAVGISEISDCITIVVSEETGNISIAKEGRLSIVTPDELQKYLSLTIFTPSQEEEIQRREEIVPEVFNNKHGLIEAEAIVYKQEKPKKKAPTKKGGANNAK